MPHTLQIALIGLVAGVVGTAMGGAATLGVRRPSDRMIGALLAISGGIMITVVFKDLIPEAVQFGSAVTTLLGALLGIGMMLLLDRWLPDGSSDTATPSNHPGLLRTSLLLGVGIALHNLPEGLAIGAGYAATGRIGLGIALVIGLHNIPEGMAMAGPMRGAGVGAGRVLGWTALAGAPMAVGAYLGAVLGNVSPFFLSVALGLAAGAMLFIVFRELLPDATRMARGIPATVATGLGIGMGFLILELVHRLPIA